MKENIPMNTWKKLSCITVISAMIITALTSCACKDKDADLVVYGKIFTSENSQIVEAFDETFSKTMRKMWVQFAKTGNPSLSADESPDGKTKEWPLYDLKNKRLMIFDEFDIHPEKESERMILDWERTYFLTKYYCI